MAPEMPPRKSESWSVGITLETQPFVDYLIRVLDAGFGLAMTSTSLFEDRRRRAAHLASCSNKLDFVDVARHGPVEVLLTREEALALSWTWERMAWEEIPRSVVPWDRRFALKLNGLTGDIESIEDNGKPMFGMKILRLVQ